MRARLCGSVSGRYRTEENFLLTKHVVAAGTFAKDAGSTPAASSLRSSVARTRLPRRSLLLRRRRAATHLNAALELRLGKPVEGAMEFCYVYILSSESNSEHYYVGLTDDLRDRLRRHNAGDVPHTAKFRPWRIKTAVAFTSRERAADFERYLKSASGRAFAKKRL